jgi:hypothetical protein
MIHRSRAGGIAAALALLAGPLAAAPPDPAVLSAKIDQHIAAGWKANEVAPAPPADDAEFLRRVYLDLAGRVPRVQEVRDFLADASPGKRPQKVDELLSGPGYIQHFTTVWRREWLPQTLSNPNLQFVTPQFEQWLRKQLRENVSYDKMVKEIVTAAPYAFYDGTGYNQPNATAFLMVNELRPEMVAAATSRLFLGVKIECAQCHNHPFDTWKRNQFWEYASFFAGLQPVDNMRMRRAPTEAIEVRSLKIPETNTTVAAKYLNGKQPKFVDKVSSRVTLAEWMTAKDNPYFARNAVNRLWGQFFGQGIIDPIDEPNDANPPSHPELLNDLATAFADSGFDLKYLITAIVGSKAYQLSSASPHASATPDRTFSRMKVRGLTPEQLFDSLSLATGYREAPTMNPRNFGISGGPRGEFLTKFNSTERANEVQTSILQALTLMNGRFIGQLTSVENSELLAAVTHSPFMTTADKVEALYMATVSRPPRPEELAKLTAYVDKGGPRGDSRKALADVYWALLNSSEFGFNH